MPTQYVVKTGDTVSGIAQRFGVPITSVSGFRSNDPAVIFPGETLTIQEAQIQTPAAPVVSPEAAPTGAPQIPAPTAAPVSAPVAPQAPQPISPVQPAATVPTAPQTFKRTFRTPSGVDVPMDLSAEADALLGGEATRTQPMAQPELEKKTKNFFGQFGVATEELKTGFELNPSLTLSYLVKQVMEATGLPDVRTNITNISKEIETLANERDAEIADIQDNPWKSAGSKQQLIQKITDKYEKKIANRTDRLTLMQNAYQDARQQAQFAATTAINLYSSERNFLQKQLEDTLNRSEKAAEVKRLETVTKQKDITTTINNLIQTYPDAGILTTDTLEVASEKASRAKSFFAKNTNIRAVADPVNGGVTFYNAKGEFIGNTNQGFVPSPKGLEEAGVVPPPPPPKILKPAISNAVGITYIDMGKLTTGQIPVAQRYAAENDIPLLSKEDANAIQTATATYNSAKTLTDTIASLAGKLITATSGAEIPLQYLTLKSGSLTRTNTNANVFENTVQAFSSLLTRAAGEKGVLTNMDVQRIINALPNFTDTKEIADLKIQQLDSIFSSQVQGAIRAYLGRSAINAPANSVPTGKLNQTSLDILNKYK